MPVDANGNRADVVIYGGSTIKRMNLGRLYEQFVKATMRDLTHKLRKQVGLLPNVPPTSFQVAQVCADEAQVNAIWDELMGLYEIIAPLQYDLLVDDPDRARHVGSVLTEGIELYIPPDNPVNHLEAVKQLMDGKYRPHYGPVTYRNDAGEMVTTKDPVLVGSLYMMMLEKTGEDWSGVASVKVNHFGVPAKLNNFDKQTSPGRQAPVRGLGESETRSFICTVGPKATMELLDQSNNLDAHRLVTETILKADHPSNIQTVVDRTRVPFGGSRPVAFTNHLLACRGLRYVYRDETNNSGEETR